ncbi:MAG: peptidyl-prolyl cis-trans isomerase [Candidatus Sulfotelmatobacter sp.]|nr:peptidyl-prolyl cis-trans isomerase [Candidatus Sulfotelmatobacter sp.]
MNLSFWLMFALWSTLGWGQTAQEATPRSQQGSDRIPLVTSAITEVAMDAPVLTIKGFCPGRKAPAGAVSATCETVITRAQFEKIAAAIRPDMTASVKQQLANLYPHLLLMSTRAEELGLDKQSPYEQMIVFSRMQILTQGLTHKLQEEASKISDQEIADYYLKSGLESKGQKTLEQARTEIREALKNQRVNEAMAKIENSYTTETNPAYFGPPTPNRGRK